MTGCSCLAGDGPEDSKSRLIDKQLRQARDQIKRQIRILLLGTGESGKTTFIKQMVIIHGGGEFTLDEVRDFKRLIYFNIVDGMQALLNAKRKLGLHWRLPESETNADVVKNFDRQQQVLDERAFHEIYPVIRDLWADEAIKDSYDKRSRFQINDSCKYFFDHIGRIAQMDYTPSNRDILFCRKATRAIRDYEVSIQNVPFRFIDVGGQRSQRQKWFMCFNQCLTSILFMVASSEYDQRLKEDTRRNRVLESLEVFEVVVNHKAFYNVSIILFLNKSDLLEEKIAKMPLHLFFDDFRGNEKNLSDVQAYFRERFLRERRNSQQDIFTHYTTAVDTENIKRVFNDVKDTILKRNLNDIMMQ